MLLDKISKGDGLPAIWVVNHQLIAEDVNLVQHPFPLVRFHGGLNRWKAFQGLHVMIHFVQQTALQAATLPAEFGWVWLKMLGACVI